MTITNWQISHEERDLLMQCVVRAVHDLRHYPDDVRTLTMDLNACHSNGCPLDFAGLLQAPLGDFAHDLYGIRNAINRDTGQLTEDCFVPRYAMANQVPDGQAENPVIRILTEADTERLDAVLICGVRVSGGTEAQYDLLRRRGAFAHQYCTAKGWDFDNVTMQQILEIRSQPGWKNPSQS